MTKTTVSRADFFAPSLARRLAWVAVLAYLVYAAATLGLTLERVEKGIGYGVRFLAGFFPPSFTETDIVPGMLESVQIALLSSLIGTALAVPIAVLAARNLMPAGVSWAARLVIIFCRSFHPVIVAIVAVKAVGFGALAGIIALTFASIGFVGKLLAEAIEEISKKQIEAVRATGASFMNVFIFGVVPQVMNRFIGFVVYETDSNLRNSTMVGIVGGGGIGAPLFTAYQRFDYDVVLTILIIIIAIIMVAELVSGRIRRIFQ